MTSVLSCVVAAIALAADPDLKGGDPICNAPYVKKLAEKAAFNKSAKDCSAPLLMVALRTLGSPLYSLIPFLPSIMPAYSLDRDRQFAHLYECFDIPAEWDGLQGKRVAVVCKPLTSLEFNNSGAARALADGIGVYLKDHVKDIHVVDPLKVAMMIDERGLEACREIGKALKADKVVEIDVDSFSIRDGVTLLRGRSTVSIQVYDVVENRVEWRKVPPQFQYPRLGSIPTADFTEIEFRNRFMRNLAEQIAWHFYAHDAYDVYGDGASSIRQADLGSPSRKNE
ncbi:MAG: hypothetical protein ACLP9L_16405 [Thermoguttaceae bacterium]